MMSSIAAAIAGGDANQINLAGQAGANAAANNYLSHDQWKQLADEIAACQKNGCPSEKERELRTRYLEISNTQDKALLAACQAGSPQCKTLLAAALDGAATQYDLIASGKLPDYYWGGSDFSGTAKLLSSPQFKGATSEQAAQMAAKLGGIILDFVPVIGDIKGFVEAQTPFDYTLAAVGTLGPLGDGVAKLIKEAKIAAEAGDAVKAINKLAEAESVIKATPGSKGSWDAALNGQLAPKTAYELTNGHKYVTDASGRVNQVEGKLSLDAMDRNGYQQCTVGKCGVAKDDGGHLIAASLGGAGDRINIVPQASTLNRGDWRAMENEFRKDLSAGKNVEVKIDVIYPPAGGARPSAFQVTATVDGKIQPPRIFIQ